MIFCRQLSYLYSGFSNSIFTYHSSFGESIRFFLIIAYLPPWIYLYSSSTLFLVNNIEDDKLQYQKLIHDQNGSRIPADFNPLTATAADSAYCILNLKYSKEADRYQLAGLSLLRPEHRTSTQKVSRNQHILLWYLPVPLPTVLATIPILSGHQATVPGVRRAQSHNPI